jgi:ABC-type dipeptide/oligopeptide/nickel transport system permease component
MLNLIARRLALGVLVAFTVMTLAFMLTRLSGDLAISIAGPQASQADVEIIRKAYGLDRPLYVQFFSWVGRAMIEGGSSNDPEARNKAYSAAIQRITQQAYFEPLHTYVTTYGYSKQLDFTPYPDELPRFYLAKWK